MISTAQLIAQFIDLIKTYLHINAAYRKAGVRNPLRRQELRQARNTAYHATQQANTTLHQHLLKFPEPDAIMLQARELIRLWDIRNTCFDNLTNRSPDDPPREAITRLNRAEKNLTDQLQIIENIIKTQSTN